VDESTADLIEDYGVGGSTDKLDAEVDSFGTNFTPITGEFSITLNNRGKVVLEPGVRNDGSGCSIGFVVLCFGVDKGHSKFAVFPSLIGSVCDGVKINCGSFVVLSARAVACWTPTAGTVVSRVSHYLVLFVKDFFFLFFQFVFLFCFGKMEFLDSQCEHDGKTDALREIYKNLYKKWYLLNPTCGMMKLMNKIDDHEFDQRKEYVFITLNPKESTDEKEFREYCESILKRSWIAEGVGGFEYRKEKSGLHFHMCGKLKKLYSPKQINQFIWKGRGQKYFGNERHIDVRKVTKGDYDTKVSSYVMKGDDLIWSKKDF
jgi:hypothetical protein